jgi:hypothetical protein
MSIETMPSSRTKASFAAQIAHMLAGFTTGIVICIFNLIIMAVVDTPLPLQSGEIYELLLEARRFLWMLHLALPFFLSLYGLYIAKTKPLKALTSTVGIVISTAAFVTVVGSMAGLIFLVFMAMSSFC